MDVFSGNIQLLPGKFKIPHKDNHKAIEFRKNTVMVIAGFDQEQSAEVYFVPDQKDHIKLN